MVVKSAVCVEVEVIEHSLKVVRLEFSKAILPHELTDCLCVDESATSAVNAPESCEWLELREGTKLSAQLLNVLLFLGRENEDLLE